jgi:hypothetical protein
MGFGPDLDPDLKAKGKEAGSQILVSYIFNIPRYLDDSEVDN